MDCRICRTKIPKNEKRISVFDHSSKICLECSVAEKIAKIHKDQEIRDVVHFAYIAKNFDLWRSIVVPLKREAAELCEAF
tara:strand:+ start:234 stop:473 length:240 start_codon:yes stop_codon:yes gene_type:complete